MLRRVDRVQAHGDGARGQPDLDRVAVEHVDDGADQHGLWLVDAPLGLRVMRATPLTAIRLLGRLETLRRRVRAGPEPHASQGQEYHGNRCQLRPPCVSASIASPGLPPVEASVARDGRLITVRTIPRSAGCPTASASRGADHVQLLWVDQAMGFLGVAMLITIAPGPDDLMVLSIGASRGRQRGVAFGLGCALGCLSHTVLRQSASAPSSPLPRSPSRRSGSWAACTSSTSGGRPCAAALGSACAANRHSRSNSPRRCFAGVSSRTRSTRRW